MKARLKFTCATDADGRAASRLASRIGAQASRVARVGDEEVYFRRLTPL